MSVLNIDISIIIPVYNSEMTIIESMVSVIDECILNPYRWELIIIDDGSSDRSVEIIDNFILNSPHNDHIKFLSQKNGGPSLARNAGINLSRGEFIAFNDSDDRWIHGKISLQMDIFNHHPEIDMIGCKYGNDSFRCIPFLKRNTITNIDIKHQVFKNYFSPPTVIFRRKVLPKTGLFNENLKYAEEGYFFNRMVYFHKCVFLDIQVAENIIQKNRWGESGLSGNVLKMELGELFNIKYAYSNNFISLGRYIIALLFSILKFSRRYIIYKKRALCR